MRFGNFSKHEVYRRLLLSTSNIFDDSKILYQLNMRVDVDTYLFKIIFLMKVFL